MTTNKHEEDSFASGGGGAYSTVSECVTLLLTPPLCRKIESQIEE